MTLSRVAVVGLGLIGGSMAAALRSTGVFVRGFDIQAAVVRTALDRGLIDEPHWQLANVAMEVDTVVIAVPVLTVVDLLPQLDAEAPPGALLLDTGSAKRLVTRTMEALPGAQRAVGGHPIAGRELVGPEASDPNLFRDRPFVITPNTQSSPEAIERAVYLVRTLGAEPLMMEPDRHDEMLARTSHLPQLLSSVLASCIKTSDFHVVGQGLKDMTRLAESDPHMWRDIVLANRECVISAGTVLIERLQQLLESIHQANGEQISESLKYGKSVATQLRGGSSS